MKRWTNEDARWHSEELRLFDREMALQRIAEKRGDLVAVAFLAQRLATRGMQIIQRISAP